jgi:hypothetical protein
MIRILVTFLALLSGVGHAAEPGKRAGKHLFVLSGQSNMARFKPKSWFTPGIQDVLGAENVIVSFHAQGGQPISKWYKQWKTSKGETDPEGGKLYDVLMRTTKAATQGEKIQTVTFIWMQGEADAKAGNSDVYLASLNGLKKQLEQDLKRTDINFIIGRLSDSGLYRRRDGKRQPAPNWEGLRKAQEAFANASDRAVWINTDDLNGKKNSVHYTKPEGYEKLGERYVEAAVKLVKAK